jgi:DNA-binding MarR family transcriptional regulator
MLPRRPKPRSPPRIGDARSPGHFLRLGSAHGAAMRPPVLSPAAAPKGKLRMDTRSEPPRIASAELVLDIANGWANLTDYSDCPIHFLGVFAALVAHGGEMPMQDLARATGRSGSSITRAVVKLGAGSYRAPGYGWLEAREDPQWRRRKLVRLTEPGRQVARSLLDLVAHGVERCCAADRQRGGREDPDPGPPIEVREEAVAV